MAIVLFDFVQLLWNEINRWKEFGLGFAQDGLTQLKRTDLDLMKGGMLPLVLVL